MFNGLLQFYSSDNVLNKKNELKLKIKTKFIKTSSIKWPHTVIETQKRFNIWRARSNHLRFYLEPFLLKVAEVKMNLINTGEAHSVDQLN